MEEDTKGIIIIIKSTALANIFGKMAATTKVLGYMANATGRVFIVWQINIIDMEYGIQTNEFSGFLKHQMTILKQKYAKIDVLYILNLNIYEKNNFIMHLPFILKNNDMTTKINKGKKAIKITYLIKILKILKISFLLYFTKYYYF